MALDPSIILGGRQPDIVNVLARSNDAAQQRLDYDNSNAMRAMLREQGPGIVAGDQNALNALARFDPNAAMGVQGDRLNMDATRQNMSIQRENHEAAKAEGRRMAEESLRAQGAAIDAAAAAKEAEDIKRALSGAASFYQKGDRQGYDAWLGQLGLDPQEYAFDQFPAHAAMFEGVLEVLDQVTPKQISPNERFKVAGSTLFDLGAEGGPAPVGQGQIPEEVVMGADGKPIVIKGPPGTSAKFTEAQSKDNVYATRAEGALRDLDPIADVLTSLPNRAADKDPTGLARNLQSDNFQMASQAGLEFLASILRKDTGAAVTPSEEEMYGRMFLPQVGDGEAVLRQKKAARTRAVNAIKAGMNADQILATERALANSPSASGSGSPSPAAQSGPAQITSDADYDALPSGTTFIGPDGKTRRKP